MLPENDFHVLYENLGNQKHQTQSFFVSTFSYFTTSENHKTSAAPQISSKPEEHKINPK